MRRNNKYRSNKTVRFCQRYIRRWPYDSDYEQSHIDKRSLWKLIGLLKKHAESPNYTNKIVLRRNYNFYQYNGYKTTLREHPPKHLSFTHRPNFVYQPYVNYIKVNQDIFGLALQNGWKFFQGNDNMERLLDITSINTPVTLIYFLDAPEHFCRSDWYSARKDGFGGCFADYHTVCSGDYCPFGPTIRRKQTSDSRINQVLFFAERNNRPKRCSDCPCRSWKRSTRSDRYDYKTERSKVKTQRRETYQLTNRAKTVQKQYS